MEKIKTPEELLDFMSNNIEYGYLGRSGQIYHYDDKDFNKNWYTEYVLESKDELLKNLYGNCFDQVEFERDWFTKNGYEIKTIFEMVNVDYENEYPTHSFLVYNNKENRWCWFENADYANRGIHIFRSFDDLITYQYTKYVNFLKTFNISDTEINRIIMTEFSKPKENISAKEYLNHVINSPLINFNKKSVSEKRDLYDKDRNKLAETIFKGERIPDDRYIVVVLVFIENMDGQFLIQKRSMVKNGLYATTGGHPKSGESSLEGLISEVKEEIGLELDSNNLELYYQGKSDKEHVFWDDYYIKMDIHNINDLSLQKEEVESIEWLSEDEIRRLMQEEKFFQSHYEEFEILLEWKAMKKVE